MSTQRIIALLAIYAAAYCGWNFLGHVTNSRSDEFTGTNGEAVRTLWGDELVQRAPTFTLGAGKDTKQIVPTANTVVAEINVDHRKKGLIWYPTYAIEFDGSYTVENNSLSEQEAQVDFEFPDPDATYDNFSVSINGKAIELIVDTAKGIHEKFIIVPGQSSSFRISYKTRGLNSWLYKPNVGSSRIKNLNLSVQTNFENIDYPESSLSPSQSLQSGQGMLVKWVADDLITAQDIGILVPEKINPGPLTTRITYFAPVCLLFFFIMMVTINVVRDVNIHPMHYLFVAAGFFSFHLLLSYLVGLLDIHLSFLISTAASMILVTSYLRSALGSKFPWKLSAFGQACFLILFSYSFFLKGTTGLTVAISSVVTLAILMRVTAKLDWDEVFKRTEAETKIDPI